MPTFSFDTSPVRAELLDHLYEAVVDPGRWHDVLRVLARAVGGDRPTLYCHDTESEAGAIRVSLDHDERAIRLYQEHYSSRNVWLRGGRHLVTAGIVRTSEMMCSRAVLERSEFYNDYLKPYDMTKGIGATIWQDGASTCNLTVMRTARAPSFGDREMSIVRTLMPDLQRAMRFHRHIALLARQTQMQADALDRMAAGLFFVDWRLRLVTENHAGRELLQCADGLQLVDGRLVADTPAETRQLRVLVADAATARANGSAAGGGVMRLTRSSGAEPLSVLVTALDIGRDFLVAEPPVASVFVFDHAARGESAASVLVRLHGLSPAEARVVVRLLSGDTIERAAAALDLSVHTARTHLKHALAKTGANRQSDLLRRILTGPAALRAP